MSDIYAVYSDLTVLLDDICDFLSDEVQNGKLSVRATNIASMLIQRSKAQLQEIAKVVPPDNDSGRYVDMQAKNSVIAPEYIDPDLKNQDEMQELYTDIDNNEQELNRKNLEPAIICPYATLPAQKLPQDEKTGFLERREKFLFYIEHQKKLYAGFYDDWMLIYNCEKDSKPYETLQLKHYDAKEYEKKDNCFEIVNKFNGKVQFYTATTRKDAAQWVTRFNKRVNKTSGNIFNKPLPKAPSPKPNVEINNVEEEEDDMKIYEELPESFKKSSFAIKPKVKPAVPKKPNLPPRKLDGLDWPAARKLPTPSEDIEESYDIIEQPWEEIYDCVKGPKIDEEESTEYLAIDEPNDGEEIYDIIKIKETKPKLNGEMEELYDFVLNQKGEELRGSYEESPRPPIKSKLFSKDKAKLKISSPNMEKSKLTFSFRSKK